MKPDAQQILRDADRLKTERFRLRDDQLSTRKRTRFQLEKPNVPDGYKDTATVYMTPIPQEEGRAVAALIYAFPQITVPPPEPEDQAKTTKTEQFIAAMHQELEARYGHHWWKSQMSQIHEDIGWVYSGMKRKPYDGQPAPPSDAEAGDNPMLSVEYEAKNRRFKREEGIAGAFDYRHVPTDTVYYVGDAGNPLAVFEIKQVDEYELMLAYGVRRNEAGSFDKLPTDITSLPSGQAQDNFWNTNTETHTVRVIEYWDRQWCVIVVEGVTARSGQKGNPSTLDEWEHGWGRVPYFAAPAFENEVRDEAYKYESPLNGVYNEAPHLNRLRTMMSNVAWLTGYPAWYFKTDPNYDGSLDDSDERKVQTKFHPGMILNAPPGKEILPIPMQTGTELAQEVAASEGRMRQFALADIAKGVSPGADTANSAISQLRRLQRSALEPMAENRAMQAREMYRFWLERILGKKGEGIGEMVAVFDRETGDYVDLRPEDIPTLNIQVKVAPDTGQDQIIQEKHAAEMRQMGYLTAIGFYEAIGKENPEEWVRAEVLERGWMQLEPELWMQVKANLGNAQAIARMIEANQQTGDAKNAIPGLMADVQQLQMGNLPGGMGSGSPGQPRAMGVRSPTSQETTQPAAAMGMGG